MKSFEELKQLYDMAEVDSMEFEEIENNINVVKVLDNGEDAYSHGLPLAYMAVGVSDSFGFYY